MALTLREIPSKLNAGIPLKQGFHRMLVRLIAMMCLLCGVSVLAEERGLIFRDVATERGLTFAHVSPFTPQRHLHLTMGSGLAWLDFDRDGRPDLYLAQGCPWTGTRWPQPEAPVDQLYRNVGDAFRPVSLENAANRAYAMGIAVGDYDNDGFPDLYLSNFGPNLRLENNGDGTFSNAGGSSVLADSGYGASCTWLDIEPDGNLDLFVTNYVEINDHDYRVCVENGPQGPVTIGCPPWKYPGAQDRLFVSLGNGEWRDATAPAGMNQPAPRRGLGVIAADLNGDGRTDLFVANDSDENELWINRGDGTFEDQGLISGTAVNREGKREAGMGVAAADVDQDGLLDLFLTHFHEETNTLYRCLGPGMFLDVTNEFGLAASSRTRLGFGTVLADFDGDGFPDCFVANGHIHDRLAELERNIPFAQEPLLLVNTGGRRFQNVSASSGEYFRTRHVGRGAAASDFDNDGRLDLAIQHLNGPVALLRNERPQEPGTHCKLLPIGITSARDPIGSLIAVQTSRRRLIIPYEGSSSYLSCHERTPLLVLKEQEVLESIRMTWPGGHQETWNAPATTGNWLFLIEGTGNSREVP